MFLKIKLKEKSTIQKLIHKVGFCIVITMNISGMIFINNKLSNQNEITKNLEQQKFTKEQEEKEQETIQVAKSLLKARLSVDIITASTGLTVEQIEKIKLS